jgi:hypothetical protein
MEHYAPSAAVLGESCEEGECPGELSVDDMVYDEHDAASPEHFLQCGDIAQERVRLGIVYGFFRGFAVDAGTYSLYQGYDKTSHVIIL